ncbi:MAG TPA: hypothetical protein VEZ71_22045 [Archangium sp.]|nr:hypothetical protein [Archangium sp.]
MTAGRKRRPAATSARGASQESLPLAPPAPREDGAPTRQAPADLPAAPAPVAVPVRQLETVPQRTVGGFEVLWVRCEECGRGRHVDVAGRHGAMPVRGVTLLARPEWPRCQHGVPYWENCRGAAVPPPCCLESTP